VRAAKLAGLERIPAIVREADERAAAEAALIENLQREDLNPIERSDGLRGLIDRFGLTQQEVGERVGLDRSSVANLLRLGELEPEIRELLASGALGLGHGKALLPLSPGPGRVRAARQAASAGWSVRRLESFGRTPEREAPAGEGASVETRDLERRLGEFLGTKVRVQASRSGSGTLTIRFFNLDHFDDLMSRIGYEPSDGT
jgi:ParB family chromosome partitioning protein